jgi:hypothetical protein
LVSEARPLLVRTFVAEVVKIGLSDVGQRNAELIAQPVECLKVVISRRRLQLGPPLQNNGISIPLYELDTLQGLLRKFQ